MIVGASGTLMANNNKTNDYLIYELIYVERTYNRDKKFGQLETGSVKCET